MHQAIHLLRHHPCQCKVHLKRRPSPLPERNRHRETGKFSPDMEHHAGAKGRSRVSCVAQQITRGIIAHEKSLGVVVLCVGHWLTKLIYVHSVFIRNFKVSGTLSPHLCQELPPMSPPRL